MTPIDTDALIIGAGPVGLFTAFQLGLREISAHVVDALPFAGGQCVELYADKPIYDIPALPRCTGRELTERLLQQIAPLHTPLHLGELVSELVAEADGRWSVRTRAGRHVRCRAVVLAAGVGAFLPRPIKLAGIEAFDGRNLHYAPLPPATTGRLVVVGATDLALRFAIESSATAAVTLVHRRDQFDADASTVAEFRDRVATGRLAFVAGQPSGFHADGDRLTALDLLTATGETTPLPLDHLVVLQGLSPRLGPIADWGLALARRQVAVDTATFATSQPGVYAVGDVVSYPGKQRLILSGFHEATLAAAAIQAQLHPEVPAHTEYTTSSERIHRLLGVTLS